MKRPAYRDAIYWLTRNDDCEWLWDAEPMISVSAALVQDLFGVSEEKLIKDIRRDYDKAFPRFQSEIDAALEDCK